MKALILNSGLGNRMGGLTSKHPKCMTSISKNDTILSRQLKLLVKVDIHDVVMTTGYYNQVLMDYCMSLELPLNYRFVNNPKYAETNYIYSIYCAREYLDDDILLIHGDLVFEYQVLEQIMASERSCMKISSFLALPEKDFKAVLQNGKICKVGTQFFENAVEAQPLYKIRKKDWQIWMNEIEAFCESDHLNCYAEDAFNQISDHCEIYGLDVEEQLCTEIDTPEDLLVVTAKLEELARNEVVQKQDTQKRGVT